MHENPEGLSDAVATKHDKKFEEGVLSSLRGEIDAEFKRMSGKHHAKNLIVVACLVGVAGFLGFVVLALLGYFDFIPIPPKDGSKPIPVSIADIIGVLVPLVLLVIAYFVGVTGLKRLQLYDDEFRAFRVESDNKSRRLEEDIEKQFETLKEETISNVKKATNEAFTEIESRAKKLRTVLEDTENRSAAFEHQYKWMLQDETSPALLADGAVSSMGELHKAITALFRSGQANAAKKLIEYHIPKDRTKLPQLRGSQNDFFNTATQLAGADLEPMAWLVCEAGLHFFPNDPDLLSNATKFASDAGELDRAKELFNRTSELRDSEKNWRSWVFLGDYIESHGTSVEIWEYYVGYFKRFFDDPMGGNGTLKAKLPLDAFDERMAAKFATYLVAASRHAEATLVAQLAIAASPRAPQCSGILSDLYLEEGKYKEAIELSEKAMADDARDQAHTNHSARLMTVALARDALFLTEQGLAVEDAKKKAGQVFHAYEAVLRSERIIGAYLSQIPERVNFVIERLQRIRVDDDDITGLFGPRVRGIAKFESGGQARKNAVSGDDPSEASDPRILIAQTLQKAKVESARERKTWEGSAKALAQDLAKAGIAEHASGLIALFKERLKDDPEEVRFLAYLDILTRFLDRS